MNIGNFYITPRVVEADSITEISISGNYPHTDLRGMESNLILEAVGADGLFSNGQLPGLTCGNGYDLKRPWFETEFCVSNIFSAALENTISVYAAEKE